MDTELGNLVKADRFGFIKRAMHGTKMLSPSEVCERADVKDPACCASDAAADGERPLQCWNGGTAAGWEQCIEVACALG